MRKIGSLSGYYERLRTALYLYACRNPKIEFIHFAKIKSILSAFSLEFNDSEIFQKDLFEEEINTKIYSKFNDAQTGSMAVKELLRNLYLVRDIQRLEKDNWCVTDTRKLIIDGQKYLVSPWPSHILSDDYAVTSGDGALRRLDNQENDLVAQDIHSWLGISSDLSSWIKAKIDSVQKVTNKISNFDIDFCEAYAPWENYKKNWVPLTDVKSIVYLSTYFVRIKRKKGETEYFWVKNKSGKFFITKVINTQLIGDMKRNYIILVQKSLEVLNEYRRKITYLKKEEKTSDFDDFVPLQVKRIFCAFTTINYLTTGNNKIFLRMTVHSANTVKFLLKQFNIDLVVV